MSHDDPVPRSRSLAPRESEPSYTPDFDGEISFVEHLTDELLHIVQKTVKLSPKQNEALERGFKSYLNKAL